MKRSYFAVLNAQICGLRSPDTKAVTLQDDRIRQIVRNAKANGLADALRETEREWQHFQSVADWVCPEGDPLINLERAIDQFAGSVADAIARR